MHWQVIHAKPKGNRNLSVTLIEVPMSDAILPHSPGKREDLHKPVGLWPCHNQGGNQYWMLSKQGEIRQVCITLIGWRSRALLPLPSGGTRHAWTLLELTWFSTLATEARAISIGSTGDQRNHLKILILKLSPISHADSTLRHGSSRRCLAISQNKEKLQMEECSEDNPRQHNYKFIIWWTNLSDCLDFLLFLPKP